MGTAANIVVAQRTNVYLSPVGTAAPVDATVALAATWKNVGFTTEDSLAFETEPSFENVKSAQSNFPTRKFQTEETGKVSVDLQEWTGQNFKYVYGGGTLGTAGTQFKFTPPVVGARTEFACIVEVIDGSKAYRYVIPRVFSSEGVQSELHKTKESTLPLRLEILGDDSAAPWYLLTNDATFQ